MSAATTHAVRVGLRRGWTEFLLSLRSAQDQGFYAVVTAIVLANLWFNRRNEIEGTDLLMPEFSMPSILGGIVVFGCVIGPGYALAMEREDGTLLRMKAVPGGLAGYVAGQLLFHLLGAVPMLVAILVPSALLFEGVTPEEPWGWLAMVGFLVLGLLATMPIGMVLGALAPNAQKVGTWGVGPVIGLAAISGIFLPIDRLWGWFQGVAQVFPMYWLGLGMRSAFLPGWAADIEIGGSWRTWQTVAVLVAWAIGGALVAPPVLRRVARRQSGATMVAAREAVGQWVR